MTPVRLAQHGWTVVHPPAGERAWIVDEALVVATPDDLWWLDDNPTRWPVADVLDIAVDAEVLVRTPLGRQVLGRSPDSGLVRSGLHATATWRDGWCIPGLDLPAGARRAPDLHPSVSGIGARWSTEGQPFHLDALGIRAVRTTEDAWHPHTPRPDLVPVGVSRHEWLLWGPGKRVWDLRDGQSHPLPTWTHGPAVAHARGAAVVEAETGLGLQVAHGAPVTPFKVPLRADAVAQLMYEDGVVLAITDLGRRHRIEGGHVSRLSGRELPESVTGEWLDELELLADGVCTIHGTTWAWRDDGLLLRRDATPAESRV